MNSFLHQMLGPVRRRRIDEQQRRTLERIVLEQVKLRERATYEAFLRHAALGKELSRLVGNVVDEQLRSHSLTSTAVEALLYHHYLHAPCASYLTETTRALLHLLRQEAGDSADTAAAAAVATDERHDTTSPASSRGETNSRHATATQEIETLPSFLLRLLVQRWRTVCMGEAASAQDIVRYLCGALPGWCVLVAINSPARRRLAEDARLLECVLVSIITLKHLLLRRSTPGVTQAPAASDEVQGERITAATHSPPLLCALLLVLLHLVFLLHGSCGVVLRAGSGVDIALAGRVTSLTKRQLVSGRPRRALRASLHTTAAAHCSSAGPEGDGGGSGSRARMRAATPSQQSRTTSRRSSNRSRDDDDTSREADDDDDDDDGQNGLEEETHCDTRRHGQEQQGGSLVGAAAAERAIAVELAALLLYFAKVALCDAELSRRSGSCGGGEAAPDSAAGEAAQTHVSRSVAEYGVCSVCLLLLQLPLVLPADMPAQADLLLQTASVLLARYLVGDQHASSSHGTNESEGTGEEAQSLLRQMTCVLLRMTDLLRCGAVVMARAMGSTAVAEQLVACLQLVGRRYRCALQSASCGKDARAAQDGLQRLLARDAPAAAVAATQTCNAPHVIPLPTLRFAALAEDDVVDEFLFSFLGMLAARRQATTCHIRTTRETNDKAESYLRGLALLVTKALLTATAAPPTAVPPSPHDVSGLARDAPAATPLCEHSCLYDTALCYALHSLDEVAGFLARTATMDDVEAQHGLYTIFLDGPAAFSTEERLRYAVVLLLYRSLTLPAATAAAAVGQDDTAAVMCLSRFVHETVCVIVRNGLLPLVSDGDATQRLIARAEVASALCATLVHALHGPHAALVRQGLLGCDAFDTVAAVARRASEASERDAPLVQWALTLLHAMLADDTVRDHVLRTHSDVVFSLVQHRRLRRDGTAMLTTLLCHPCQAAAEYHRVMHPLAERWWRLLRYCENLLGGDGEPAVLFSSSAAGASSGMTSDLEKDLVLLSLMRAVRAAMRELRAHPGALRPTRQLQGVLCSPRSLSSSYDLAEGGGAGFGGGDDGCAECFVPLLHRLSLPWTAPLRPATGLAAVLATVTSLVRGSPLQRAALFATMTPTELVRCVRTEWFADRAQDWQGFLTVLLGLVYEDVVEPVVFCPPLLTQAGDIEQEEAMQAASLPRTPSTIDAMTQAETTATTLDVVATTDTIQSPELLPPLLLCFVDASEAASGRWPEACATALQALLWRLLRSAQSSRASLFLMAHAGVFEGLTRLLRPLLTAPADLRELAVALMTCLAGHHVHVRQVKQLFMLLVHAHDEAERRAMLPVVIELLSHAARAHQGRVGNPLNYVALYQGRGQVGIRGAVPDFPADGYTVSMWARLEPDGGVASSGAEQCLFSLCTITRRTVMALMVCTSGSAAGTLSLHFDDGSQSHSTRRAGVAGTVRRVFDCGSPLPMQRWVHLVFVHRPAQFLYTLGEDVLLLRNGSEAATMRPVPYPRVTKAELLLGTTAEDVATSTVQHALTGQLTAVYLFARALSAREVRELYRAGSVAAASDGQDEIGTDGGSGNDCEANAATDAGGYSEYRYSPLSGPTPVVAALGRVMRPGEALPGAAAPAAGGARTSGGAAEPPRVSMVDGRGPSAVIGDVGITRRLAEQALVCLDPRLSEEDHLYNLAALLRERPRAEAWLTTYEGVLTCQTNSITDALCVLGPCYTVVMPLAALLAHPRLPLAASAATGTHNDDDSHNRDHGAANEDEQWRVQRETALLTLLDLTETLSTIAALRAEMLESGVFTFIAQVLQELGPTLGIAVPERLMRFCAAMLPYAVLFDAAYSAFFLCSDLLHACADETLLIWVNCHRIMIATNRAVLARARLCGAQLFVVDELLSLLAPTAPGGMALQLRGQLLLLLDSLTVEPITMGDALPLVRLVAATAAHVAHGAAAKADCDFALAVLRSTRALLFTRPALLAQYVGKHSYPAALLRLLVSPNRTIAVAVRHEALLQLILLLIRSRRTQQLMGPDESWEGGEAGREGIATAGVDLAWLAHVLLLPHHEDQSRRADETSGGEARDEGGTVVTAYLALRAALLGHFGLRELPTRYTPLQLGSEREGEGSPRGTTSGSGGVVFGPVLAPLLLLPTLCAEGCGGRGTLRQCAVADLAVLLGRDPQTWRRLIAVPGWYVLLTDLYVAAVQPVRDKDSSHPLHDAAEVGADGEDKAAGIATLTEAAMLPSTPALLADAQGGAAAEEARRVTGSCASALAFTLFSVLLHESYGANELQLVVGHLQERRLPCLLNRVLRGVADLYRSTLRANAAAGLGGVLGLGGVDSRRGAGGGGNGGGVYSGLGVGTGSEDDEAHNNITTHNFVCFVYVVEDVMFYLGAGGERVATGAAEAGAARDRLSELPSSRTGYTEWNALWMRRGEDVEGAATQRQPGSPHWGASVVDTAASRSERTATSSLQTSHSRDALNEDDDAAAFVFGDATAADIEAREALQREPDGRWLHHSLALKLLHILLSSAAMMSDGGSSTSSAASALSYSLGVGTSLTAGTTQTGAGAAALSAAEMLFAAYHPVRHRKGGFLRLVARLLRVTLAMTLRSTSSLSALLALLERYCTLIDTTATTSATGVGAVAAALWPLRRTVSVEECREHSPLATTTVVFYCVHDLLLRRLRAGAVGGFRGHDNVNRDLITALQSLFRLFRASYEQVFRGLSSAGHTATGGDVYTANVDTVRWLCDGAGSGQGAHVVDAFVEIASREDYSAFLERCLPTLEREQLTDKGLAATVLRDHQRIVEQLHVVRANMSQDRLAVEDHVRHILHSASTGRRAAPSSDYAGDGHVVSGDDELTSMREDEQEEASVTAGMWSDTVSPSGGAALPVRSASSSSVADSEGSSRAAGDRTARGRPHSCAMSGILAARAAAGRALRARRAMTWLRFAEVTRGTIWQPPSDDGRRRFVRVALVEQQPLVRRRLLFSTEGTDHSDVTSASLRELPTSQRRLRLRGGEAILLEAAEDEDDKDDAATRQATAADEAGEEEGRSPIETAKADDTEVSAVETGKTTSQSASSPSRQAAVRSHPSPNASATPDLPRDAGAAAAASYSTRRVTSRVAPRRGAEAASDPAQLMVACEVPYMMHCWSATLSARGGEVSVLFDEHNRAYNQSVADEARPFLIRPASFSFNAAHIELFAPGRRFRMKRTGIELWLRDRRSYFLNFSSTETMRRVLRKLHDLTASGQHARLRRGVTWYVLHENPTKEPLLARYMADWRERRMSSLDYLLWLNLLAGRSVNDLTQYPVMPWVIADYTSDALDLTRLETFRDLRLPMGMCGAPERGQLVRHRYEEMKELGDVPSHYFTHYSSPAVTLYYLIRLEPFTTLQILLQGGHFDHADRMFHSVSACYRGVTSSTQDVRELIPELYYMPELCRNTNKVPFGYKQDHTAMNHLQLPPWAHDSPYEFVYRMREALECDLVSSLLHHWIDLIFGYKQRGKEAIAAANVFNWHAYEDLDRNRGAAVDQQLLTDSLDNIGQIPVQLFRSPHCQRRPRELVDPLDAAPLSGDLQVKLIALRWGGGAVMRVVRLAIAAPDRVVLVNGAGAATALRLLLNPLRRRRPPTTTTSEAGARGATMGAVVGGGATSIAVEENGGGTSAVSSRVVVARRMVESYSCDLSEEYELRMLPMSMGVMPNARHLVDGPCTADNTVLLCYESEVFIALGGLFDHSVVIRSLSGITDDVRLRAHRGRVVRLAASADSRYMVTGAEDTTFAVWRCMMPPGRYSLEVEFLFSISGHEDNPTAVDISATLDLVATASLDGVLMLHALGTGSLDRTLRHPAQYTIDRVLLLATSYVPSVLFLSQRDFVLHQVSLNGTLLRSVAAPGRITSWCLTPQQYILVSCLPYTHAGAASIVQEDGGDNAETGGKTDDGCGTAGGVHGASVVFLHSFFLATLRTVPLPVMGCVHSIACHPHNPQVIVLGTGDGHLALMRLCVKQPVAL